MIASVVTEGGLSPQRNVLQHHYFSSPKESPKGIRSKVT